MELKSKITGDSDIDVINDNSIIMMNHRTRLDWMFAWCLVNRFKRTHNEKIIMKDSLKSIPFFGWGMQSLGFIFLSRNWSKDEKYLDEVIHYYGELNYPIQLLIFPEGTDLQNNSKKKSDEHAQKEGLPILDYVLHPRVKGFHHCYSNLRKYKTINCVYDVTIAYPDYIPQNESSLFKKMPKQIHFHVNKIKLENIPENESEVSKWLEERWQLKEQRLKAFYKNNEHFEQKMIPHLETDEVTKKDLNMIGIGWIITSFSLLFLTYYSKIYAIFLVVTFSIQFVLNKIIGIDKLSRDWVTKKIKGNNK